MNIPEISPNFQIRLISSFLSASNNGNFGFSLLVQYWDKSILVGGSIDQTCGACGSVSVRNTICRELFTKLEKIFESEGSLEGHPGREIRADRGPVSLSD